MEPSTPTSASSATTSQSEPLPESRGQASAATLGIIALALLVCLVRFVRLGEWSLWIDEVFTWGDAHAAGGAGNNWLGYDLVRWTVAALGGEPTETALRLMPAAIGYLAIPLTLWAFHPLAGARRAALAALVVGLSAWEIQWSQTARFYTMVQAVGLVGAGVAVRGLLAGRWLLIVAGVAICGLGVAFHEQGAIVAAAIGLAAFLACPSGGPSERRSARLAFITFAVPGLLATPMLLKAWAEYAHKKPVDSAVSGVAHFALSTGAYVTPTIAAMALGALIVAALRMDRRGLFVGLVPVLGGLILAVLSTRATVSAQYAFALFPWIALLATWPVGTASSFERSNPIGLLWPLALAVPLLSQTALYFTVEKGQRPRWRDAIEYVAQRRQPTDVIVAAPAPVVEFYLTGGRETDVRRHDSVVQLDTFQPRSYEPLAENGRVLWFVLWNDSLLRIAPKDRARLKTFLSERCRLQEHFPVHVEGRDLSIDVWRFDGR